MRYTLMALAVGLCALPAPAPAQISAGIATVDITPPVGYRMAGYFNERLATGVLDPLQAKALVLKQRNVRVAMVFCDLLGIAPHVADKARKLAAQSTGIPFEHIVIAATHAHTGPMYGDALREHFHTRAVQAHGKDPHETVDYAELLATKLAAVIALADLNLDDAQLHAGAVEQPGLAFNRRFFLKDGTVRFNPGPLNPQIDRVAGPIDPQLGIVAIRQGIQQAPVAALVNFALHLDTTGGTLYSADYPFHIERTLREAFGKDFLLLFGTGACGDINHIDITSRERAKPQQIGARLGAAIKQAVPNLRPIDQPALAVRRRLVTVPLQRYSPERLAWARSAMDKIGTQELPFLDQVEACKIMSLELRGGREIGLEVQAIRLGDATAIVCLPGEVFVELGLWIKRHSPFPTTLVIELCNDEPAYIPTRKAFAEGSYETVNSRIAPGGGEAMAEAAVHLLTQLASDE